MTTSGQIVVALPAYNEERYIGTIVLQAKEYADKVLVVDDGSTDDTAKIASLAGAIVVRHNHNMGYGAAIQQILHVTGKMDVGCVVVMDADYQHDAKDIPSIAAPVLSGDADMVVGHRETETIPRYRRIGQSILSMLTRRVSGSRVQDTQSGFRAYSPKAVASLVLRQNGMAASSELTSEAARLGLKVVEVPVRVRYDGDGSTHNPVAQGVHTMTKVLNMIAERKPLLFFGVAGAALLVAGFASGVHSYNVLIATGYPPVGTMLVSAMLIIVGLLSSFTGVILHTVVRVLGR